MAPDRSNGPTLAQTVIAFDPPEPGAVCPAALQAEFLDLPDGVRLYALFDGTQRAAVLGTNDLDCLDDELGAQPLFQGEESDAGPWLINLSHEGPERDGFLADYFARHVGERTGLFLRSSAEPRELWSHLRGLLKVAREGDDLPSLFLRFWDPPTAEVLLGDIGARPERAARIAFTRTGASIDWFVEDGPARMHRFTATGGTTGMQARKPLTLDASDEAAFGILAFRALERTIGAWLAEAYPGRIDAADPAATGAHVVSQGRSLGFTLKDEFAYLGHMMVYLGGWFHRTGLFPGIDAVLNDSAPARHKPLREAFPNAWSASYLPVVAEARAAMLADLGDEAPFVTHDRVRDLFTTHLPGPAHPGLRPLWRLAMAHARDRGAPEDLHPAIGLVTMFAGYRFYEDPFTMAHPAPANAQDWEAACRSAWCRVTSKSDGDLNG